MVVKRLARQSQLGKQQVNVFTKNAMSLLRRDVMCRVGAPRKSRLSGNFPENVDCENVTGGPQRIKSSSFLCRAASVICLLILGTGSVRCTREISLMHSGKSGMRLRCIGKLI